MRQEIKYTLLACAACFIILFVMLGGHIYPALYMGQADTGGMQDMFREDLRSQSWTMHLSMLVAFIPTLMAGLFYYVINSVHFDRWWNWLIVAAISALLTAWGAIRLLNSCMEEFQPGLSDYYAPLTQVMAAWAALFAFVIFTVSSFGMRWWSSNCRHTPIPQ